MAYKKFKYRSMSIDNKLVKQINAFAETSKIKKSFRQASKDFADHVELIKWKYLKQRKGRL